MEAHIGVYCIVASTSHSNGIMALGAQAQQRLVQSVSIAADALFGNNPGPLLHQP